MEASAEEESIGCQLGEEMRGASGERRKEVGLWRERLWPSRERKSLQIGTARTPAARKGEKYKINLVGQREPPSRRCGRRDQTVSLLPRHSHIHTLLHRNNHYYILRTQSIIAESLVSFRAINRNSFFSSSVQDTMVAHTQQSYQYQVGAFFLSFL